MLIDRTRRILRIVSIDTKEGRLEWIRSRQNGTGEVVPVDVGRELRSEADVENITFLLSVIADYEREKEALVHQDTARHYAKGMDYYRGIVHKVGALLGLEAFIADDGGINDSVLADKIVELVERIVLSKSTAATISQSLKRSYDEALGRNSAVSGAFYQALVDFTRAYPLAR